MSGAPFPVDPELTGIAIAFKNPAHTLIADQVMPRVNPPLTKKLFKWWEHDLADGFTIPETLVGRTGRPNETQWNATEREGSTKDYGLEEPVPQDDIDEAKGTPFNPLGGATERTTNLVILDRERRVAGIVFSPTNYESANVQTLSGASQFTDPSSDPIKVIREMLDGCIVRPNSLTMGQLVWSTLVMHPNVLKTIYPSGNGKGVATRQQIAEALEVNEILVGASRVNMVRRGQVPQLARTWGNHIAGHFKDPTANNQGGVTWGFTMQKGTKVAGAKPDGDIGLRGGMRVRSGESVAEVVAAKAAGILILNAV